MPGITLESIEHQIERLLSQEPEVDFATGEMVEPDEEFIAAELKRLVVLEREKVDSIARGIGFSNVRIQYLKDEEKRIRDRRQALENRTKRFKDWLVFTIKNRSDEWKIKGNVSTLSVRHSRSLELDVEPENLPPRFQRVKIEADKTKIGDALKAGRKTKFAHLQDNYSLIVR